MDLPKRKSPRLKQFDYSLAGAYFITICTHERKLFLSHIAVGRALAPAEIVLTQSGMIAEKNLKAIEERYPFVRITQYVIMPNHIHMIILLQDNTAGASTRPTISDILRTYKSLTARECKSQCGIIRLFQTSFHDHIIRNDADYVRIAEYIENNPAKWTDDCFYISE